jgi:hypothetical protein
MDFDIPKLSRLIADLVGSRLIDPEKAEGLDFLVGHLIGVHQPVPKVRAFFSDDV